MKAQPIMVRWNYGLMSSLFSDSERERMLSDLAVIPALNKQAQLNLTGNAKDLWITGIRDIREQAEVLESMKMLKASLLIRKLDGRLN